MVYARMYQINRKKVDHQKFHFILLNINKYESKDKDNYQQKQFDLFLNNIYNIALIKIGVLEWKLHFTYRPNLI